MFMTKGADLYREDLDDYDKFIKKFDHNPDYGEIKRFSICLINRGGFSLLISPKREGGIMMRTGDCAHYVCKNTTDVMEKALMLYTMIICHKVKCDIDTGVFWDWPSNREYDREYDRDL